MKLKRAPVSHDQETSYENFVIFLHVYIYLSIDNLHNIHNIFSLPFEKVFSNLIKYMLVRKNTEICCKRNMETL